ncbi:protoporphyrinogen oxidase [Fusarium heterosporum]|uniref:Protoporphyrinogen oxidase n=1 Tax=Fusarium heterosporum TaxID=42747 RepID=A0A8H5U1T9_FUSHE|nr:protoporphyrinogen oxidase [Fusarium heterosporum]
MASYLITGASRGLGFGFLKELSKYANNTIIELVRNKAATDDKIARDLGPSSNVHILEADITDYNSLKASVDAVSKITGGSLDYVIANAGLIPLWSAWGSVEELVNVIGNSHLFSLFTPLVLNGQAKKVVAISSGMSDIEFIRQFEIEPAAPYAISKAGISVMTAKFAANYAKDGVLFMSICPGSVDSGFEGEMTEAQTQKAVQLANKFVNYASNHMGPSSPEDSAKAVLSVMHEASLENGSSGAFVSRFGNRQWMSYEITVLGATGWTATICAHHIAKTFPTNLQWCIAGRSVTKLQALRQSLRDISPDRLEPTIYVIPQLDSYGLDPIISDTDVIINGIGPYHQYGTPVVESCARNGTHYVDFCTETQWISDIIRDYDIKAKESGAIIIPAISGSSAPSDLVAWLVACYLRDHGLPVASEVICSGKLTMHGMQGGSLHTVLGVAATYGIWGWLSTDISILSPETKSSVKPRKGLFGHRYDRHLGHLATSFVAWGNESVVQRSAALNGKTYGDDFVFMEYIPAASLTSAVFIHIVTKLGIILLAISWFRCLVVRNSLAPGTGPDRAESRQMESAEWKAIGYVKGSAEALAFARFRYSGALVDMVAILAVESAAAIKEMVVADSGSRITGLSTPSALGSTFVNRLRATHFDIDVHGLADC